MPFYISDRALAVAVTAGLVFALYSIRHNLQAVKDAARTRPPQPTPSQRLDKDAENRIPVETLRALSQGYNRELRGAAFKIVLARSVQPNTKKRLLHDLASRNEVHRENAINAFWYIINNPDSSISAESPFLNLATYQSIVKALVNLLPHHHLTPPDNNYFPSGPLQSPILPFRRPSSEHHLLLILTTLLRRQATPNDWSMLPSALSMALEAGLIKRWLTHYPFPCTLPGYSKLNYKKADVFKLLGEDSYGKDDPLMMELFRLLSCSSRACRELASVGLRPRTSNYREDFEPRASPRELMTMDMDLYDDTDPDVTMVNGEDTAGVPSGWRTHTSVRDGTNRVRSGGGDRSQEEERMRRRHREAIVVAERGMPVGRENILTRVDSDSGALSVPMAMARSDDDAPVPDTAESPVGDEMASHLSLSPVNSESMPEIEDAPQGSNALGDMVSEAVASREERRRREEGGEAVRHGQEFARDAPPSEENGRVLREALVDALIDTSADADVDGGEAGAGPVEEEVE